MTDINNCSSTKQFYFLILCLDEKYQFTGWKFTIYSTLFSWRHRASWVYFQMGPYFLLISRLKQASLSNLMLLSSKHRFRPQFPWLCVFEELPQKENCIHDFVAPVIWVSAQCYIGLLCWGFSTARPVLHIVRFFHRYMIWYVMKLLGFSQTR